MVTCMALAIELSSAFAANEPKDIVNLLGSTLSEWCRTDKIERRVDIENCVLAKTVVASKIKFWPIIFIRKANQIMRLSVWILI